MWFIFYFLFMSCSVILGLQGRQKNIIIKKNKNIIKKNKKTIPVLLWDIFMAVPVKQRRTSSFFIAFYTVRFGLYFLGKKM